MILSGLGYFFVDHGVNDPKLTVTWLVFDDSIEDCFGFQILLVPIEHVGQDRTQEGHLGVVVQ